MSYHGVSSPVDPVSGGFKKVLILKQFLVPHYGKLKASALLLIVATAADLAGPALVRYVIDTAVPAASKGNLSPLIGLLALYLLAGTIGWGSSAGYNWLISSTAERSLAALRRKLFSHTSRLDLEFYRRERAGGITSRIVADVDATSGLVTDGLPALITGVLTLIVVTIVLFSMNAELAAITLASLPAMIIITLIFRRVAAPAYARARIALGALGAALVEATHGSTVVQAFGQTNRTARQLEDHSDQYRIAERGAIDAAGGLFGSVEAVGAVSTAVVLWFGTRAINRGELTVGMLIAFILYLGNLFEPIRQLSDFYNTFQGAAAALERVSEVLAEQPTIVPGTTRAINPLQHLTAEGLSFKYPAAEVSEDAWVLRDFALDVPTGKSLALVGATGAGKSTFAKLVLRFYDPQKGKLELGGIGLDALDAQSFHRSIAMVPQEGFLFGRTVWENIAFGKPGATRQEAVEAAESVGVQGLIEQLTDGFDHHVNSGGTDLAAGQRQAVAIARAWLADGQVLVLDEPTAELDAPTERQVSKALGALLAGRSVVVIAHRLTTVLAADRVAILAGGRIVQEGATQDLLATPTYLRDLYDRWLEDTMAAEPNTAGRSTESTESGIRMQQEGVSK